MKSLDDMTKEDGNLKIMTYNILHGFYTYYDPSKPMVFQKERFDAAQKLVKQEKPDILILLEACFGVENKTKIIIDYKKVFADFPHYFYAQSEPKEHEWGTALLSKYPITSAENMTEILKPFVRAKVNFNGIPVNIDIAHPHPDNSNEEKEKFFRRILESRKELEHKNYILTGDFNSLSPEDKYNRERLIRGYEKFDKTSKKTVGKLMSDKSISYLLSQKLIDSHRRIHKKLDKTDYTMPTDFLTKNKDSSMRIDYIFCSKDIEIKDAGIIKNELSEKASDHYPVYAELEI